MVSSRAVQVAVIVFLIIIVILLMRGYIGVTETVLGITIGMGGLVTSAALDEPSVGVRGGGGVEIETPSCCEDSGLESERDIQGMGESINFERVLVQKLKLRANAKRGKRDPVYAHQEACREVLTGLTGLEFYELSAAKPRPKGEHIVPTKEYLEKWYKVVDGEHVYLDLDGWAPDERLAFEYRGPIHDENVKVQENDRTKETLASDQNIKLMILHYGIPAKLMTRYIYTKLVEWKVPLLHGLPRIAKLSPEQMTKLDWNYPRRLEELKV